VNGSDRQVTPHLPRDAIFTVGHSVLPIADFLALLQAYGINCLADIRTVPRSRHNPQFNTDALAPVLDANGIEYVHLRALGGLRHPRPASPNSGWRNKSFRGYADYMQSQDFIEGLEQLIALSRTRRAAMMCAEAVPWRCHRSLVGDALLVRGLPVIDILSQHEAREHRLTPFARVDGTRITYPSG
jgi:uncharacterized protein (DUF488 family)